MDFSIFPHLNVEMLPWNTLENAGKWAARLTGPCYAVDDQTAFQVVGGVTEIISEGSGRSCGSASGRFARPARSVTPGPCPPAVDCIFNLLRFAINRF